MNKNIYSNLSSRIHLIIDAFIGASSQFDLDKVSIIPSLDIFHLLDQRPLVFAFHENSNLRQPVYHTFQDKELRVYFEQYLLNIDYNTLKKQLIKIQRLSLSVHHYEFDNSGIRFNTNKSSLSSKKIYSALIKTILANPYSRKNIYQLEDCLIKRQSISGNITHTHIIPHMFDDYELRKILDPLRNLFDDVLSDMDKESLIRKFGVDKNNSNISNLFAVVRTATKNDCRNNYNYSARLILSDSQKKYALSNIYEDNINSIVALENPLGYNSRSIADTVFHSGIIDFSAEKPGEGRDACGYTDIKDKQRHLAENKLYSHLLPDARVFYIPIHINSVPWLALFTLTPNENSSEDIVNYNWYYNYQVYRSLIPKIAERLRTGVKREYLKQLAQIIAESLCFSAGTNFIDILNSQCQRLMAVYPYDGLNFSTTNSFTSVEIILPHMETIYVSLISNPYFTKQVNYDSLPLNEIKYSLESQLKMIDEVSNLFFVKKLDTQKHTIYNEWPGNNITHLIDILSNLCDKICNNPDVKGELSQTITDINNKWDIVLLALRIALENKIPIDTFEDQSINGILDWLIIRLTSSNKDRIVILRLNGNINISLPPEYFIDAFNVIFNFWQNGLKVTPPVPLTNEKYRIVVQPFSVVGLEIVFITHRRLPIEWLNYLLDLSPAPNDINNSRKKGFRIIKECMKKLGWYFNYIDSFANNTTISLIIPK